MQKVVEQRCLLCHGAQVQMKNVRLDSPQEIASHAQAIYQQVVVSRVMPMKQFHRHDRRRTRADRHLVQGGRAHALGPPAGAACCRSRSALPFHPSSLAFMPIYDATLPYPRDLAGYGRNPPHARWPGGARITVQFVLNYEEGGENSVLHGDPGSEQFLSEMFNPASYGPPPFHGASTNMARAPASGASCASSKRRLPLTVFGVGMALQRHPELASACVELGHEIACHGWRWVHYQDVDEATEREHMFLGMQAIEQLTGARPLGWYTGRDSPARAGWWPTMAASNTTATTTATTCRSGCRCAEATARSCRS